MVLAFVMFVSGANVAGIAFSILLSIKECVCGNGGEDDFFRRGFIKMSNFAA